MTFTVHHDPEGYACNMGWIVRNAVGTEVHRGPEWSARANAHQRNAGTYVDPEFRGVDALVRMLGAVS